MGPARFYDHHSRDGRETRRRLAARPCAAPTAGDYNNRIVFLEVLKPERLVYQHEPEPGSEPVSFQTTVTFAARGEQTELTMRMLFPSAAARDNVVTKYGAIEGAEPNPGPSGRLSARNGRA